MKSYAARVAKYLLAGTLIILSLVLVSCATTPTPSPNPAQNAPPGINFISIWLPDLDDALPEINAQLYTRIFDESAIDIGNQTFVYYHDVTPPTEPGQPAFTAEGTYQAVMPADRGRAVWNNLLPGEHTLHTLSVQLTDSDYAPLSPPVIAETTMYVPGTPPIGPAVQLVNLYIYPPLSFYFNFYGAPSPATPINTLTPGGYEVIFVNSLSCFKLNQAGMGQPNAPGEGHFIYYKDAEPPMTPGQPATTAPGTYQETTNVSFTWIDVPAGTHTFAFQLVNNDNTPLDPPVLVKTSITLPPLGY